RSPARRQGEAGRGRGARRHPAPGGRDHHSPRARTGGEEEAGRRTQRRRRVRQAQATRRQERVAYLFDATPPAIEAIAAAACDEGEEKAADDRYVFCELHRLGGAVGAL